MCFLRIQSQDLPCNLAFRDDECRDGFSAKATHRLEAMRRLGAKSITALVIPEREVAWQILALNTEKAHNLKERSPEVIRIYRGLIDEDGSRPESGFAFYLDQAALVTLGVCYERVTRFGGGAYRSEERVVSKQAKHP